MSNCEHVFKRNSHKVTKNVDSSSQIGQPCLWVHRSFSLTVGFPRLLLTALSCWLPCSVHFFLFVAFSRLLPVSWEILCASPLCGVHAKTDKGILWLAPTETNATDRVTVVYSYTYRCKQKYYDDFNKRTNTLLYKNISHTLFLKGLMLVVCEMWVGDGNRLLHIDPKFLWP